MEQGITPFRPLDRVDGYLPIADHALIGDGTTAALVGRDGSVSWLCVPRFDSRPVFAGLLDAHRGGAFTIAPADEGFASRQRYVGGTGVVVTEMRSTSGLVRITDALALRAGADLREDLGVGRGELLRCVEAVGGSIRLRVTVQPRGAEQPEGHGRHWRYRLPFSADGALTLHSSAPLRGAVSELELAPGERVTLRLDWVSVRRRRPGTSVEELLGQTIKCWRRWSSKLDYAGPRRDDVERSAITLKLLDHIENGACVAAPTSSLPERVGGARNWDYRYAWVRDAAFSVFAMRRVGMAWEALGFLGWVLDAVERHGRARVLYDLDGERPPPETEDPRLEGYRRSRPVRWGNAAAEQAQHDIYGEILDCAFQWAAAGGEVDRPLWRRLRPLITAAATQWQHPDQGIWEVRSAGQPFTYSAAMCHVALDRGARLAERLELGGDCRAWRRSAEAIATAILNDAWDERRQTITDHLGGGTTDAALLALPLRRVVSADHEKMKATCEAIVKTLSAGGGLLYRYRPEELPDGVGGEEGAFLLCSFWLADNLALQGELERALELYESLCARSNDLGLLPEQIDPTSGAFLGNFPQALSHVGLISSGVTLARLLSR